MSMNLFLKIIIHASGMGEEYTFKGISMYSDDGKNMRRFESGLEL